MKLILSILLTPIFYLLFGLTLLVFHPIQIICLNLFGYNAHKNSVVLLNWFLLRSMNVMGTSIRYKDFRKLPDNTPLIIICNHQSMFDIPPLIWKLRQQHLKFVSKIELANNVPSISYNLNHGGSVVIDRSKPDEAIILIAEFANYLKKNNYAVCIFPEGSRSKDGVVKRFKHGGIEAIIKTIPNALVVPIAIKNAFKFDNSRKFLKGVGIRVEITMLEPRQLDISRLPEQMEEIRSEVSETIS